MTINPDELLFTVGDVRRYVSTHINAPCIVVAELDNKKKHAHAYTDYELGDSMHIHLYVAEQYLHLLPELVMYSNSYDLSKRKKEKKVRQFKCVGRQVYDIEGVHSYLAKQYHDTRTPMPFYFLPANYIHTPIQPMQAKQEEAKQEAKKNHDEKEQTSATAYIYTVLLVLQQCIAATEKKEQEKKNKKQNEQSTMIRANNLLRCIHTPVIELPKPVKTWPPVTRPQPPPMVKTHSKTQHSNVLNLSHGALRHHAKAGNISQNTC